MRLLICGGRDFKDVDFMVEHLESLHRARPVSTVIVGRARGADSIGEAWAEERGIPVDTYPAQWNKHGRRAGPIRNQQMLDEGKPDLVMAFPGGTGTAHMVKIAELAGVETWVSDWIYFRKEDPVYGFMSNFNGPCGEWKTAEHYYQAMKSHDAAIRRKIFNAPTPNRAKKLGNIIDLRPDWDTYKFQAMREALRLKFDGENELSDRLLDTGADYLVEYAPWGGHVLGRR